MWEHLAHGADRTVELASKVAFLRTPRVLDGAVECLETHMSWVFLTEDRVFKLKKPVKLPFLDHSTLDQRHASCRHELRLGRRLAADVYLEIAPLVATEHGLAIATEGEVVDWLVVMRRLPADRMLPRVLAAGAATTGEALALGDVLAGFYRTALRSVWDGPEYRHRLRNLTVSIAGELVARGAPRAQIAPLVQAQLATIEREARALDRRVDAGRVVDAHGDLRPEHVCLETPPVVIDPLEFDAELRTLDAASELAFFALECERLDAAWFGDRVVARCAERLGDEVLPALAMLYRGQHALTRALIALRHLDDVAPADHPRWRAKAADYLRRAAIIPPSAAPSIRRDAAW